MDVSIILATHNRPDTLKVVLSSFCHLEQGGIKWEVIIVDNAGGDEANRVVKQFEGKLPVTLIVQTHLGKSNALNTAMARAQGALFLFTDDDVIVDSKWLINTWEGVEQRPHHSVFGGRILPKFPNGTNLLKIKIDFEHTRVKGCYAIADSKSDEGDFHPWMILGPNWAIRSELFRLGYMFRTDIGPGTELIVGEETELAYRLGKAGFTLAYLPKSVVYHNIRQEQLTVNWIYRRVFKSGRSWALNGELPNVPLLFGVPRYLFISVVIKYIKYVVSYFQLNHQVRFHCGLKYWFEKGYLYQFLKGPLTEIHADSIAVSQEKKKTRSCG